MLLNVEEAGFAREYRDIAQFVFDTKQLVVFRDSVRTAHRTGLDLSGVEGDRDIRNGRILDRKSVV